jgi:hypothetical protein
MVKVNAYTVESDFIWFIPDYHTETLDTPKVRANPL